MWVQGWYARLRRHLASRPARRLLGRHLSDVDLPGFDRDYYLATYPDVAESGLDPLSHFLLHGWSEGRDPSRGFSSANYLLANPDVAQKGINPLLHFLRHGIAEGRGGWQVGYDLEERQDGASFREDIFHYYRRKVCGE